MRFHFFSWILSRAAISQKSKDRCQFLDRAFPKQKTVPSTRFPTLRLLTPPERSLKRESRCGWGHSLVIRFCQHLRIYLLTMVGVGRRLVFERRRYHGPFRQALHGLPGSPSHRNP